jgi:nucleoside phosphorylase
MTLGIVAAMSAEMRTITRQRVSMGIVARHSSKVLLALSGIGPERARTAGKLLLAHGATALLSWGTAAALDSNLAPGSLILPKTMIAADETVFPVCPEWHDRLRKQLSGSFKIYTGTMVESPAVLFNSNDKHALFERSGGIAVDMESAAIAAVAYEAGIPLMIVRCIADSADMAVPQRLVYIMEDAGGLRQLRLLVSVTMHPREWSTIARLATGFYAARKTLARIVSHTDSSFSAPA